VGDMSIAIAVPAAAGLEPRDVFRPPVAQRLSVPSAEVMRRWSPQYVRPRPPARGLQRHRSNAANSEGHWLTPPRTRHSGSSTDSDSSTDDHARYTALDLTQSRRHRRHWHRDRLWVARRLMLLIAAGNIDWKDGIKR